MKTKKSRIVTSKVIPLNRPIDASSIEMIQVKGELNSQNVIKSFVSIYKRSFLINYNVNVDVEIKIFDANILLYDIYPYTHELQIRCIEKEGK